MRRFFVTLLALATLAFGQGALAQGMSVPGVASAGGQVGMHFPPQAAGGSSYTGIQEAVGLTPVLHYGFVAASATWADGAHILGRLRRSDTSEKCDVRLTTAGIPGNVTNCSGSTASDSALASAWCSTTTCYVDTLRDQGSNAANATQGTAGTQPAVLWNCQNSLPCMVFTGVEWVSSSTPAVAQPLTVLAVAVRTGGTGQGDIFAGGNGVFFNTSNSAGMWFTGSGSTTAGDNVVHALQFVVNGASSGIKVDAAAITAQSVNASAVLSSPEIGAQNGVTSPLVGKIMQISVFGAALNSTQQTAGCNKMSSTFGLGLSC